MAAKEYRPQANGSWAVYVDGVYVRTISSLKADGGRA